MSAVKPDYGLDAPGVVKAQFSRGAWFLGIGLVVFLMNRAEYPEVAARILSVFGSIGGAFLASGAFMVWSSRVAKLALRDRLLDALHLSGNERVLDVGCGRGLMLIGAAKRLKTGKATGVDIWSQEDLAGNTADAAKENAKLEGVSDKVKIDTCDARKLVYPEGHFDVVVSNLAIHNIQDREGRAQAVKEMLRVLKPGGKVSIYDIFKAGEYAEVLRAEGAQDVTVSATSFLWCVPGKGVTARK